MSKLDFIFKSILITGAAGFIGSNLVMELVKTQSPVKIIGIDNMNDYYDVSIKEYRLEEINKLNKNFIFIKGDISDKDTIDNLFNEYKPSVVVNLAAQAGVRYSITNPDAYIKSNLIGFYNILEACRHNEVEHLVYASSSSVYGSNKKVPYSTDDKVDNPVSLYAATKKSNELMAHAYSKLYNIPSTGLRFFTVYGPKQRPDLAINKFTRLMLKDKEIPMFGDGSTSRDYTYIDDIVDGVIKSISYVEDNLNVYEILNLGNSSPVTLKEMIQTIETYFLLFISYAFLSSRAL